MLKIGLTGGIGSGKSLAADYFAKHGVAIIDADQIVHQLLAQDATVRAELKQRFADRLCYDDAKRMRGQLRQLIFADSREKKWLEALLHPRVRQVMMTKLSALQASYAVLMIPLLNRPAAELSYIDRILVVHCPHALQVMRAIQRDQRSPDEIESIIAQQMPAEKRLAIADDIICNDGSKQALADQVAYLHAYYLKIAALVACDRQH